jgi:alpha-amylase/alpha-mannosidase (GH57 family)
MKMFPVFEIAAAADSTYPERRMANVVFLWHMHQPYYVDPTTRTATMPWVRLHSVKGYLDMVMLIEEFPAIRVNFNLTPVLMLQIKELIQEQIRDLWLDWSRQPAASLEEHEKFALLENFFKIHRESLVKPFPRYWELLNKRGLTFYRDDVRRGLRYFSTQEFLDLQTWFNLAWCGYSAVRLFPELAELRRKGRNFTEAEKQRVLDIHLEIMGLIVRKYREAEERGQVELTTTPFFHPILPLVYDSAFAERCLPGRKFPPRFNWPEDAAAHLTLAVEQHAAMFGRAPRGVWPSEGSIAPELIPLMQRSGIEYFCSDEENLFNSLRRAPEFEDATVDHLELFQGWRVVHDGASVNALFREKPLSDFIGFMAAKNDPAEAATHLLHHLRHIADVIPENGVIPLILDGENAWETFSDGGESFLRALYVGIGAQPDRLRSCTIEQYFRDHPPRKQITTLHTGSWIGSNFDIWIGDEEENRAWDLLGQTRAFLQREIVAGRLSAEQRCAALREIYAAEGSDWFWWYGPDFSTDNDALFDTLFRQHLKSVYTICGHVVPAELERPIANKIRVAALYDRPTALISPEIDGRAGSFYKWTGAGLYVAGAEQGAMYRSDRWLNKLRFGNDQRHLYLRLELLKRDRVAVNVKFHQPSESVLRTDALGPASGRGEFSLIDREGRMVTRKSLATAEVVELAVPLEDLGVAPGAPVSFQVQLTLDQIEIERSPENVPIEFTLLDDDLVAQNWFV